MRGLESIEKDAVVSNKDNSISMAEENEVLLIFFIFLNSFLAELMPLFRFWLKILEQNKANITSISKAQL